jgi:hypothetical protein
MKAEVKLDETRKQGGDEVVGKAIAKCRKKNIAKEVKSLPYHMIS